MSGGRRGNASKSGGGGEEDGLEREHCNEGVLKMSVALVEQELSIRESSRRVDGEHLGRSQKRRFLYLFSLPNMA